MTLVSNTGQASGGTLDYTDWDSAQAFSTGSDSTGYKLTAVKLLVDVDSPSNTTDPTYTVSVRSDSSGSPGSSLSTLTNPSALAHGVNSFSAAGTGIDLAANTTYWVVVDVSAGGNRTVQHRYTSSNGEDAGAAAGWSIADTTLFRDDAATTWPANPNSSELRIAIDGYAKSGTGTPTPPTPTPPTGTPTAPSAPAAVSPDPSNLARSAVQWEAAGGMHPVPARMGEISSNKPQDASASVDLSVIAASVREELREQSRGFYVTTLVESTSERRQILRNLEYELARGSPLLKVSIWHIYRRASTGINTVELLGEVFLPRKVNLLTEPVEICVPAPTEDADRARIAVRGRTDADWTILETTLEDGQLCARTTRVAWFTIVLEPESEAAAA